MSADNAVNFDKVPIDVCKRVTRVAQRRQMPIEREQLF
jgi:hypothetical protein